MSRTLTAAREIQRNTQLGVVLPTCAFLLRAASAIVVLCEGVRDGVTAYRRYEQLRARGAAHAEALKGVRVDSDRTKLL